MSSTTTRRKVSWPEFVDSVKAGVNPVRLIESGVDTNNNCESFHQPFYPLESARGPNPRVLQHSPTISSGAMYRLLLVLFDDGTSSVIPS